MPLSAWGQAPWGHIPWGGNEQSGSNQNLSPDGVASSEAFGSAALVYNQSLSPSGIASGEAFGTPLIPGRLFPSGIGTSLAFGVPTVTGPILPDGIASGEAFGNPTVNLKQTVIPSGVTTAEAFGVARVSHVTSISPSGIASGEAFGNPTVKGATQYLRPSSIDEGMFGTPSVTGGKQTLQVFVGNYDRSDYLRALSLNLRSQTKGRWTATMDFFNVPKANPLLVGTSSQWKPQIGQTIQIKENGRKWFAGCIAEASGSDFLAPASIVTYAVQALDKSSILDHRVIPTITFTADQDAADVLRYVLATYLNGEGISGAGIPATMGALGTDIPVTFWSVAYLADQIANLTGFDWFIDFNGIWTWTPPASAAAAPFNLTDSSRNFRNLSVRETLTDYRNKQYVVSNRNVLPGDGTGATPARTETFTLPYAPSVAAGLIFGVVITSLPILQVTGVRVNGIAKTPHTALFEEPPVDLNFFWNYFPGNVYITPPVSGPDSVLSPGDVVAIDYVPYAQQASSQAGTPLVVVTPPLPPPGEQFGTCGSGIYEAVEQVTDITTQDDLNAVAAGLLDRSGVVPTIVQYETDFPGLEVGMLQQITLSRYGLTAVGLFITGIEAVNMQADLGHTTAFRVRVTAMNTQDIGNWTSFWSRLIRRTTFGRPFTVVNAATFVLGPGLSIAAASSVTNVLPVLVSGRAHDVVAVTDNPPTDQDLIISITYDGAAIFPPGQELRVPSGSTAVQSVSAFAGTNLFVFQNHKLRITTSYRITGPNPVAAQSVTVMFRVEV